MKTRTKLPDEVIRLRRRLPARVREYRIEQLVRIVRFAYSESGPAELQDALYKLKHECVDLTYMTDFPGDPVEAFPLVKNAQKSLLDGLNAIVFGKDDDETNSWSLPPMRWEVTRRDCSTPEDPEYREYHMARTDAVEIAFLYGCAGMICGPEGWRLQACSEPGCLRFYIKRKKGAYCDQHNSARLRSQRHREAMKQQLTPEERTIRRYCYYLAQLRRNDVKRYNERLKDLKANQPERYKAVMGKMYRRSTRGKSK